jgi:hypothetical protein
MFDGVILITEIFLAALLGLLGFRMVSLARGQAEVAETGAGSVAIPDAPKAERQLFTPRARVRPAAKAPAKGSELVGRLCIIFSLQERDCREQGLDLGHAPDKVRFYALAWLFGAASELCVPAMRNSNELKAMVAQIAGKKLRIGEMSALQALETLTTSDVMLACFRHGLEGAEHWSRCRYVKGDNGIYTAITSNAFL